MRIKRKKIIYRAWRRNPKTGEIEWAKHRGFKAWRFEIEEEVEVE
ncbi:hypothetical protein [Capillibacterium thermochitinicola]|nr:hypothetical protein [Capillibacterium thermochitinicola]